MEKESNCIFCKIVAGEIPCHKVWEDENNLAFLDINPVARGHVIVIPKKHVRWLWDLDEKDYSSLMLAARNTAGLLKSAFGTECVQESVIGFDVHHTHIHLYPRFFEDGLPIAPTDAMEPKPSNEELAELARKIRGE